MAVNDACMQYFRVLLVESHVVRGAGGLNRSPNSTSLTPGHDTHFHSAELYVPYLESNIIKHYTGRHTYIVQAVCM
eukprot:jgi/Chrzof1/11019/Cz05g20180.t1